MKAGMVSVVTTHVPPASGYGGVVVFAANLARAWGRQGRSFLFCASDASRDGRVTAAGATTALGSEVWLYRAFWFKRWGFGLGALWQIPRAIRRAETAYICGVATWPVTIGALAAWLLRRPYVVSPHGGLMAAYVAKIRRSKPHKWRYLQVLTLPLLRRARAIHVLSEVERDGVLALLPEAITVLIPNGIDHELWRPAPPLDLGRGNTLCFVGRVASEKGIKAFVETWLRIRRHSDRLIVAGDGDDSYAEEFRKLVGEAGDAIELIGYVDQAQVYAVLARSHFLILPSGLEGGENEALATVVAEALAVGRPVLVTRGHAWDRVESAGIGLTFERTAASIEDVLDRVHAMTTEEYGRMCAKARRFTQSHLDLEQRTRQLWELVTHPGEFGAATSAPTEPDIAEHQRPS